MIEIIKKFFTLLIIIILGLFLIWGGRWYLTGSPATQAPEPMTSPTPRLLEPETPTPTPIPSPRSSWNNIHWAFTPTLMQEWTQRGFTYTQTKDWIDIGLQPAEAEYAYWLAQVMVLDPLTVLNEGNEEDLQKQFSQWQQTKKDQSQSVINPNKQNNQSIHPQQSIIKKLEAIHSSLTSGYQQAGIIFLIMELKDEKMSLSDKLTKLNSFLDGSLVKFSEADKQEINSWVAEWKKLSKNQS